MTTPPDIPANPYVGPRPFARGDRLYGRDQELSNLLDLLISERIVLLHSPSGAGKTSLIQAGLIPALEDEHFRVLPIIRVGRIPPGPHQDHGTNSYLASIVLSLGPDPASLPALGEGTGALSEYLNRIEPRTGDEPEPVVLVFDQFEEILTLDPIDLEAKRAFFAQVGEALRPRHRWALFAMREKFAAGLEPFLRPIPTQLAAAFRLGLLEPAAARAAIREPAASVQVDFSDDALEVMIDELTKVELRGPDGAAEEGHLPFVEPVQLQVVCTRLWGLLPWATLPLIDGRWRIQGADVAQLAKVEDALTDFYDGHVARIAAARGGDTPLDLERQIREWIDTNLITDRGTRAQLRVGAERDQTLPADVLAALEADYLIRREGREGRPGDDWYELAHDRLVPPVAASNAAWLDAHLSPVQRQARQWRASGQRPQALFRGRELRNARGWVDANRAALPEPELKLLTAFLDASARENRAHTYRLAAVVLALLLFLGATATLVLWQRASAEAAIAKAIEQEQLALEQTKRNTSLRLANQSAAKLNTGELDTALLLGKLAVQSSRTLEARQALINALQAQPGLITVLGSQSGPPSVIAVSPDGTKAASAVCTQAASACQQSEIHLLDLGASWSSLRSTPLSVAAEVLSLAFSPDGQSLAAGTDSESVALWDLETRQRRGVLLKVAGQSVPGLAFSADGQTLAAGSTLGAVVLWDDWADPRPVRREIPLPGDPRPVTSMAFGPDGTLAVGRGDATVLVWNGADLRAACAPFSGGSSEECAATLPPPRVCTTGPSPAAGQQADVRAPRGGPVRGLTFSPDGAAFAAAVGNDGLGSWRVDCRFPDATSLANQGAAPGPPTKILGLTIGANNRTITAVTANRTIVRWVPGSRLPPDQRATSDQAFSAAAFLPGGTTFVAGLPTGPTNATGDVVLWDATNPIRLAERIDSGAGVRSVAITPDGLALAAGSGDGAVQLWDLADPQAAPVPLAEQQRPISAVAFSPDGHLAAGSGDGTVLLWNRLDASASPFTLAGNSGPITSIAFGPESSVLVLGSADGAVRLWNAADPAASPSTVSPAGEPVLAVAFDRKETHLGVARADGTIQVWALSDLSAEPVLFEAPDGGRVYSIAFSPDGKTLAAGYHDGSVRLWDRADPEAEPLPLEVSGPVKAVAYSPFGTLLAAAEGTKIHLWDVATNLEIAELVGHTGAVLSLSFASDAALASGGEDRAILVWSLSVESMEVLACHTAGRDLDGKEWSTYMPNVPDEFPCAELLAEPGSAQPAGEATAQDAVTSVRAAA